MGTNGILSVISPRLKREEYDGTKHDSIFSEWKTLIGPQDWENHLQNKDGAEKYRTQNLPNCSSCSGLYEIGIPVSNPKFGVKLIPVYIGQSDNVRTRLQQYGRDGAHLKTGHGLFTEVFSRGFSLVYRWAPMKNKRDAEETEKKMLDTFDYAWNKGSNGARRIKDILQKLNDSTSSADQFCRRRVGLRLKSPLSLENASSFNANLESNYTLSRIIKFGRLRPTFVSIGLGVMEDSSNMCGVALGQGSVCARQPVEGRKRCAEHKGMRVGSSAAKLITEGGMGPKLDGHQDLKFNCGKFKLLPDADKKPVIEDLSPICGVILVDGTRCTRTPVHGRERCEEHKGKRIQSSVFKSISEKEEHYVHGPILEARTHLNSQRSGVGKDYGFICGVDIEDGKFCTRQPVVGRKRCEEHKGMKVKEQESKLKEASLPSVFAEEQESKLKEASLPRVFAKEQKSKLKEASLPSVFAESGVCFQSRHKCYIQSTCGAMTLDGSACKRSPAQGRSRCFQHEGMRAEPTYNSSSSQSLSYYGFQSTCGAMTRNGSACKRSPAQGRSRCWQH